MEVQLLKRFPKSYCKAFICMVYLEYISQMKKERKREYVYVYCDLLRFWVAYI